LVEQYFDMVMSRLQFQNPMLVLWVLDLLIEYLLTRSLSVSVTGKVKLKSHGGGFHHQRIKHMLKGKDILKSVYISRCSISLLEYTIKRSAQFGLFIRTALQMRYVRLHARRTFLFNSWNRSRNGFGGSLMGKLRRSRLNRPVSFIDG